MSSGNFKSGGGDQGDWQEKKRKECNLDLAKYLEKSIRVKFAGGREAAGILKGFDPLLNFVKDNTTEFLRYPDDPYKITADAKMLVLVEEHQLCVPEMEWKALPPHLFSRKDEPFSKFFRL